MLLVPNAPQAPQAPHVHHVHHVHQVLKIPSKCADLRRAIGSRGAKPPDRLYFTTSRRPLPANLSLIYPAQLSVMHPAGG
jgi:hypothetical protein